MFWSQKSERRTQSHLKQLHKPPMTSLTVAIPVAPWGIPKQGTQLLVASGKNTLFLSHKYATSRQKSSFQGQKMRTRNETLDLSQNFFNQTLQYLLLRTSRSPHQTQQKNLETFQNPQETSLITQTLTKKDHKETFILKKLQDLF